MRKMLLMTAGLAVHLATAAQGNVPPNIVAALKSFAVSSHSLNDGVLRVVMSKDLVTQPMFSGVVTLGVCAEQWRDPRGFERLGLTRIEVLNTIDRQGFAFTDAAAGCAAIGKLKGTQADAFIEQRTVTCEAGVCRPR